MRRSKLLVLKLIFGAEIRLPGYLLVSKVLETVKVRVGDEQYSNQCKKLTIQSIEINSDDDESLTLMSDQIIPTDMQDSGIA